MHSLIDKTRIFLSDRRITLAIVGVALCARFVQLFFFNTIHRDSMYQIMAMQNFADGHGISMAKVYASDLSLPVYVPEIRWPPGYSFLLYPVYLLCQSDYSLAVLLLAGIASVALLFYSRALLFLFNAPVYLVNIFTLLSGFTIYSFCFSNSSDTIAITFFVMAVYYTFRLLKKERFSLKTVIAVSICLFFPAFIKYMYLPVIFIVPVFIFMKGYANNSKTLKKSGIISFLLLIILIGSFMIWQKLTGGSTTYIKDLPHGFYPENLRNTYPAFSAPFFNPLTLAMVFGYKGKMILFLFRALQFVHLLLFFIFTIYIFKNLIKSGFRKISLTGDYCYLSYFVSAGIILLLAILSMRIANEGILTGYNWTYVQEPRYYGLIDIMMHIGLFLAFIRLRKKITIKYKLLPYLIFLLMLPEAFRGINFTFNRLRNWGKETYDWKNENQILNYADKLIMKELKTQKNENVVVTGSFDIFYYSAIYSHIPLLPESKKINDISSLNTKKPVMLLVILQENELQKYQEFIKAKETELAGYIRGFYFYTLHVKPH